MNKEFFSSSLTDRRQLDRERDRQVYSQIFIFIYIQLFFISNKNERKIDSTYANKEYIQYATSKLNMDIEASEISIRKKVVF